MLGAIIGDIAGSRFEWENHKSKEFTLLAPSCRFTDDSVMSLAVCQALLDYRKDPVDLNGKTVRHMQNMGRLYAKAGYGGRFFRWIQSEDPQPYNSFGNGSAMRVSGCGFAATDLEEAVWLAGRVTEVTHNHPEGLKGAQATASAVYLARTGHTKEEIRTHIVEHYYPLAFTLDDIRPSYQFDVSCQGSVPQALEAFLESEDFEDAIRNAISIGGDSDTIAAIAGGVAEAYYGIPAALRERALTFLDEPMREVVAEFEEMYPPKIL